MQMTLVSLLQLHLVYQHQIKHNVVCHSSTMFNLQCKLISEPDSRHNLLILPTVTMSIHVYTTTKHWLGHSLVLTNKASIHLAVSVSKLPY